MMNPAPRGLFSADLDYLQVQSNQIELLAEAVSALVNGPSRLELALSLLEAIGAIASEMNDRLDSTNRVAAGEDRA